jgi:hypothetical protein
MMDISAENQAEIHNATQGEKITILVIFLITTSLVCKYFSTKTSFLVRVILTFYQIFDYNNLKINTLYIYLYYEFPYHLFNVTAYIVLMQW